MKATARNRLLKPLGSSGPHGCQAATHQCLGKSPCPGCHPPTRPITPSLGETQVTARLSGQQPEYVHGHQGKKKGCGRSQSLRPHLPSPGGLGGRGHLPETGMTVERLQAHPSSNTSSLPTSCVASGKSPDLSEPHFVRWKLFLYLLRRVVLKI